MFGLSSTAFVFAFRALRCQCFFTRLLLCVNLLVAQLGLSHANTLEGLLDEIDAAETLKIQAGILTPAGVCLASRMTDNNAQFHVASIAKLFTAVKVLQLRDVGLVSLDAPAKNYLPEFNNAAYSLRELLTHTSGLRDRRRPSGRSTRQALTSYYEDLLRQAPRPRNKPAWRYADANFNVLGLIIERVTGRPFVDIMADTMLQPLAMHKSSFLLSDVDVQHRVTSYNRRGHKMSHPWDLAFAPSAGLQTTAADLLQFAEAILAVPGGGRSEWLSQASLLEMVTPYGDTKFDGVSQGLGWQLGNGPAGRVWRHAGGEDGFESLLAIYPDLSIAIVVLGNHSDWPRFVLARSILDAHMGGELRCQSE